MRGWLITPLIVSAAAAICTVTYLAVGYHIHWPTFVYAAVMSIAADIIKEVAE